MAKLIEFSLDYDNTFTKRKAEKHDGFASSDEGITAINSARVFPIPKKMPVVETFWDLMTMDIPPVPVDESPMGYIKYSHEYLPIQDMTEPPESHMERSRREALARMRIDRQVATKEASEAGYRNMSESFKLLTWGVTIIGALAVVVIGLVVLSKGSPV